MENSVDYLVSSYETLNVHIAVLINGYSLKSRGLIFGFRAFIHLHK